MKQDQWFEPGDKVMRVMEDEECAPAYLSVIEPCEASRKGVVLCVEKCWREPDNIPPFNLCRFVGIALPRGLAEMAACFRRVEEIKLCVRAAKLLSEPAKKEAIETQPA